MREKRIAFDAVKYDPDPESWPESDHIQQQPGENEDDFWDRKEMWIKATRRLVYPDPEDFEPLTQPDPFDLKGHLGIQVIVKLANIHLTPEKTEYNGGTWHVEGQMVRILYSLRWERILISGLQNEHIVATSLYYYSTENITTSKLSFRQQCESKLDVDYQQNDDDWLTDVFGCKNWTGTIQDIGSVETREGRLLTFPNILQHRVEPFKLADPTKCGHRKMVALFLVDPNIKITSTAHVPCQQQEWWWETVMATKMRPTSRAAIVAVPIELQDGILEEVDFPFSLKDAKAFRLELMKERKNFTIKHGQTFEHWNTFSLCEH